MITVKIMALLFLLMGVVGCHSDSVTPSDNAVSAEETTIGPGGAIEFRGLTGEPDLPTGRWEYKDGAKICNGYLTRFESEDYCAAEVPKDWVPFTFEGETYYVQPLSGS